MQCVHTPSNVIPQSASKAENWAIKECMDFTTSKPTFNWKNKTQLATLSALKEFN